MSAESQALRRAIDRRQTHEDWDPAQADVRADEKVELPDYDPAGGGVPEKRGTEGPEHSEGDKLKDKLVVLSSDYDVLNLLLTKEQAKNTALLKEFDKAKQVAIKEEVYLGELVQIEKQKVRMLSSNVEGHPGRRREGQEPIDEIWLRVFLEFMKSTRSKSKATEVADDAVAGVKTMRDMAGKDYGR